MCSINSPTSTSKQVQYVAVWSWLRCAGQPRRSRTEVSSAASLFTSRFTLESLINSLGALCVFPSTCKHLPLTGATKSISKAKSHILDLVLSRIFTHDTEGFSKPAIRSSKEHHKFISVDDPFDVIKLAHKLQATDLLTHANTLIEKRPALVVHCTIFPNDSHSNGPC
jgi:hypothetical protein